MDAQLIGILVGLSLSAFAFSLAALIMGCLAWTTMVGLKNSTHQVQYVPLEPEGTPPDNGGEDEFGNEVEPERTRRQRDLHNDLERSMGMHDFENEFI